jgi:alkylhydroperoxidase family enzyme
VLGDRPGGIAGFSAALAFTPPVVSDDEVSALVEVGLTPRQMVDLVFAVAQFSWANRTMLPLGETTVPDKKV